MSLSYLKSFIYEFISRHSEWHPHSAASFPGGASLSLSDVYAGLHCCLKVIAADMCVACVCGRPDGPHWSPRGPGREEKRLAKRKYFFFFEDFTLHWERSDGQHQWNGMEEVWDLDPAFEG